MKDTFNQWRFCTIQNKNLLMNRYGTYTVYTILKSVKVQVTV